MAKPRDGGWMRKLMTRGVAYGAAGLAVAMSFTFALAGPASAGTLVSGPVTLSTTGTVTANTAYASGQSINIAVAANTTMDNASLVAAGFPSGAVSIKALECADPGGITANLPTKPSECDPNTISSIAGANADGSFNFTGYPVYSLPNVNTFGEPTNATPVCGIPPNYCVIGLFSNYNDFSKPLVFSAAFVVKANSDDGGENPGDGTCPTGGTCLGTPLPEAPLAISLPLVAGVVGGATFFFRRRKQRTA